MTAPKLRFKEFDGDWIYENIQGLVDSKILDKPMDGNHGEIHPTSADYVEDGIPFVMATDIFNGQVYLNKSKKIPKKQADSLRKGFSLAGDILLTHKATIGNVAVVPELNTPYVMLTPQVTYYRILNKEKLIPEFLKNNFESPYFQNELLALCTGATRLYIGISEQRKIPFRYCCIEEQTKIASFLSAVDEKISQLTQKHALLSQYKQGMMQKLFSQQIRFKADDGGEFAEWGKIQLKDVAERVTRKNKEDNQNALTISAQMGLVNQQDYFSKQIASRDLSKYYLLHKGEFAYNKSYSAGYPMGAIKRLKLYEKGVVSTLYICFALNDQLNAEFFEHYVESGALVSELEKIAQEGARNHGLLNISLQEFFEVSFVKPCLEEQIKIANFLSAIDQKIEVVAQQIEQAKTWKKGLLQQMFV